MGFASGAMSFRRYAVVGEQPGMIDQGVLDKLAGHVLEVREHGVEELEYGWSGGKHVFDQQFSFGGSVFNEALHFALRIDTNRVPSSIKKAYTVMEEEAAAASNPSGFISKQQKRDVKDVVRRRVEQDMKDGKYRRSKLAPILWDLPSATLYTPASNSAMEKLHELFERTFGLTLEAMSAGGAALKYAEGAGKRRSYEDARPSRFVAGPEGESQVPEYPWAMKGPQPKDFLGNEFLLWLWHEADARSGTIETEEGRISVLIDRALDLDCAYGQTGKDSLRATGPTRMPEARDALRSGKLPRKAGLMMDIARRSFEMTFNAESFGFSSLKLPEIEEAEDARVEFEERIATLRELTRGFDALYQTFLKVRFSSGWESQCGGLRKWIMTTAKPQTAVA